MQARFGAAKDVNDAVFLFAGSGGIGGGVIDIRQPIGENIKAYARAANKPVGEVVVAVLDRF